MREIPLSRGLVAVVDDEDYEDLSRYSWYAKKNSRDKTFYAYRNVRKADGLRTGILMHRQILGLYDPKVECDHKDGNGWNNQKENLREATHKQNMCNRRVHANSLSRLKGVTYYKRRKKWRALIQADGVQHSLGYFPTAEMAHAAYCAAAERLHGRFARTN